MGIFDVFKGMFGAERGSLATLGMLPPSTTNRSPMLYPGQPQGGSVGTMPGQMPQGGQMPGLQSNPQQGFGPDIEQLIAQLRAGQPRTSTGMLIDPRTGQPKNTGIAGGILSRLGGL